MPFSIAFRLFTGRLLLTLNPMTCPNALTPLSVLPHFEYSQPSQLMFPVSENWTLVGNIIRDLKSAFQSSSSIVGLGVALLILFSYPLKLRPKYAILRAINRVEYFERSNSLSC